MKFKKIISLNCIFSFLFVELVNFFVLFVYNKKEVELEYNLCELNFLNFSCLVIV